MAEYIEREEYCEKHCRCSNEYCDKESCPIWKAPAVDVAPVGWISVKDKLPEPEQDVLVIAHGWSGRLLYIGSYQRMEAETSWLTGVTSKASDWLLWGWSYLREPEVTHWMPLPEPPTSARMDGGADNETD
jgi:hypothetical protein